MTSGHSIDDPILALETRLRENQAARYNILLLRAATVANGPNPIPP
jgi:hypothetical protein